MKKDIYKSNNKVVPIRKEFESIIISEDMDDFNNEITSGIEYHFSFLDDFYESNSLSIRDNKIEFRFIFSMSQFYYKAAISAYTIFNILDGCIHNEFSDEISNKDTHVLIDKDLSDPFDLSMTVTISHNDTDISEFINRMKFISIVFAIQEEILNETVHDAALNARILKIEDPVK